MELSKSKFNDLYSRCGFTMTQKEREKVYQFLCFYNELILSGAKNCVDENELRIFLQDLDHTLDLKDMEFTKLD